MASVSHPVTDYIISDQIPADRMASSVAALQPHMLVALGTAPASFARNYLPKIPLVYALVEGTTTSLRSQGAVGVSSSPSPAAELLMYKMVMNDLKRIVTFYHPGGMDALVEQAKVDAAALGMQLVAVPVAANSNLEELYLKHSRDGEAIWILHDPNNMASAMQISSLSHKTHVPILCSTSRACAKMGAMMAVTVNAINIGSQTGVLANNMLADGSAGTERETDAAGGSLTVNLAMAEAYGVKVPAAAKPFIADYVR